MGVGVGLSPVASRAPRGHRKWAKDPANMQIKPHQTRARRPTCVDADVLERPPKVRHVRRHALRPQRRARGQVGREQELLAQRQDAGAEGRHVAAEGAAGDGHQLLGQPHAAVAFVWGGILGFALQSGGPRAKQPRARHNPRNQIPAHRTSCTGMQGPPATRVVLHLVADAVGSSPHKTHRRKTPSPQPTPRNATAQRAPPNARTGPERVQKAPVPPRPLTRVVLHQADAVESAPHRTNARAKQSRPFALVALLPRHTSPCAEPTLKK